jgi:hypothetical protein
MAPSTSIHPPLATDPAPAARARLAWAERRRAAAAVEARQAERRLAAAEERLRQARQAVRAHGVRPGAQEMVGMGYYADEVAVADAA